MGQILCIAGAPGVGKTTVSEAIQATTGAPRVDFGTFRDFHLLPDWGDANEHEERMSFENLLFTLKNYLSHDYPLAITTGLPEKLLFELPFHFSQDELRILTLTVSDPEVLVQRLGGREGSRSRELEEAAAWNHATLARDPLPQETRLDTTHRTPEEVMERVYAWMGFPR